MLLAVALSGAVCACAKWLPPSKRYNADGAPLGFPAAGLALALALAASLLAVVRGEWQETAAAIAYAVLFVFAVGAISERLPVAVARPLRTVALAVAAVFVVVQGVVVGHVKLPFGPVLTLGHGGPWLTGGWVFLVALLVTLSTRGEALVPGIAVFSSLTLCAVAGIAGDAAVSAPHAALLGLATAAAALPVLVASSLPSLIRFGMGGGMAAGLALGCVSALGAVKHSAFLAVVVPALCLGAPLLGAAMTLAANRGRTLGTVLLEAERVSFVGVLVRRGMTARQAVAFLLAWHVYLCVIAVLLAIGIRQSWMLKSVILLVLGGSGVLAFGLTFQIVYGWRSEAAAGAIDHIDLLGIRVDRTSFRDAVDRVMMWSERGTLHHVVTADATLVDRASRDPALREIIGKASLVTPDGAGVLFSARVLGAPFPERVSGVDLVGQVCAEAATRGIPIYLLGAEPGVAREAGERLRVRWPHLKIAGVRHGYFEPDEEPAVVDEIAGSGARIALVGLGVPRQEAFIDHNREWLGVGVAIGVGGTFDVLSGKIRRAPEWMQRMGLEWLWRAAKDPKRFPRLIALPRFVLRVMLHTIRSRRPEGGRIGG